MVTRPTVDQARATSTQPANVIEELRRRYDLLTHSQKRIAEYIVRQSHAVAFSTVDQMAVQLGVNPSTIVRFCYRLGLNGFPDLQERMRQVVRGQLSLADELVDAGAAGAHLHGTAFGESLSHDMRNLHRTIRGLKADDLNRAVNQLIAARRVYVVAGFSAFSVAHYFGLVLSRLRPDVYTIQSDEGVSKVRLAEIGQPDCIVAFTFQRYAQFTQRAVAWARERNSTIIVITDTPISAAGQIADTVLVAFPSGTGKQNSMVAPMAVANALLNGVVAAKGTGALDRYTTSDSFFDTLNSFPRNLDHD
ncbi:MAG: MurR/RpiR family transcriptional regulator [Bradyrhizobiaceae bacterium]|nr:MurR/RpiR family transcriptional regulator [Bradyrhizobiaceae bacterium]